MTNRVDRLATRGFVERLPDPSDRRGVQVRLTPAGRTAVDGALTELVEHEKELLAELDDEHADVLVDALRVLARRFA
jgi:DNA-binding MarR family transcriptional regulator